MQRSPRVLFIVEPYPSRSGGLDFETPFLFFLKLAYVLQRSGSADCGVICSRALKAKYPNEIKLFSPPAGVMPDEPSVAGFGEWLDILRGTVSNDIQLFYQSVFDDFDPNVVYVWNINEVARRLAERRSINTIFVEQGAVRSRSGRRITFDPLNYGPNSLFRQLLDDPLLEDSNLDGRIWAADHVIADVFDATVFDANRSARRTPRFVILGQKDDDVNNMLFSPFADQLAYYTSVLQAFSAIRGVEVTVRPHPLSGNASELEAIAKQFNVGFDGSGGDVLNTVALSDAFITVNSSAGFEALICGRPVMILGSALYRAPRPEFATLDDLPEFAECVMSGMYWHDSAMSFVGKMLGLYIDKFSASSHFAGSAKVNLPLIVSAMDCSTAEWRQRFLPASDSGLGAAVEGQWAHFGEMEAGFVRYLNHANQSTLTSALDNIGELQEQNAIRISQLKILEDRAKDD